MAAVAVGASLVATSAASLATVLVVEDCVHKMNAQCLL
jgi:hypothetical protein